VPPPSPVESIAHASEYLPGSTIVHSGFLELIANRTAAAPAEVDTTLSILLRICRVTAARKWSAGNRLSGRLLSQASSKKRPFIVDEEFLLEEVLPRGS
jgi:hypothetical protein